MEKYLNLEKNLPMWLGVLFFTCMIYLGYATMIKKNIGRVNEPVYLPVLLETAESLKVGSTVTLLGVPVGILGSLHYILIDADGKPYIIKRRNKLFLPEKEHDVIKGQFVIAILDLTKPVELYSDYEIVTQYPALFSLKTVDIRPGKKSANTRPISVQYIGLRDVLNFRNNDKLPTVDTIFLARARNFGDPLFLLTEIIGENRKDVRRIVRNIADITWKMNAGGGTFSSVLNKRELDADSRKALASTAVLVKELDKGLESYRESNGLIRFAKSFLGILMAAL